MRQDIKPDKDTGTPSSAVRRRRIRAALTACVAAAALGAAVQANAVGSLVDVTVVDRDGGGALGVHPFQGRHYVAGRPGARYAIRVTNRTGERVLAVMSVDGMNIINGQTAAWGQSGYVLQPWASHEITGWRKSAQEVAAFEFAALPDSYAALTGRPNDVGVIGVALFNERFVRPQPPYAPEVSRADRAGAGVASGAAREVEKSEAAPRPAAPEQHSEANAARPALADRAERLGTAHGARENSYAGTTTFVRRTSQPAEQVSILYDRYENLARAGVFAPVALPGPSPFPLSRNAGYVPDPPMR